MIAKIKVVVLNKHGMPIWVEFKNTLSQALYYYEEYKDKEFVARLLNSGKEKRFLNFGF